MSATPLDGFEKSFLDFKNGILNLDPVHFIETNLTLDGKPFRLNNNGYKPFADIYRYIGIKAIEEDAKPVVLVKGRQVGATTMAAALECYFVACGLYGNNNRPPMRIMHLFPTLSLAAAYTKDKFAPLISASKPVPGVMKSNGMLKSFIESKMDTSSPANDSLHFKKFLQGNQVWIESTGLKGDRIRGRQLCLETELPTPNGFVKLKGLKKGDQLFDENGKVCNVTKMHPIQESPESYRVTFDDNVSIDACAEHLWLTYTKDGNSSVKNTVEIIKSFDKEHSVPACLPEHDLYKYLSVEEKMVTIKSIEPIPSKPMRCITVDSPSHLYLVTRAFIATHNTVDCALFDECQDIPDEAIGAVTKILAQSKYGFKGEGVQVYFGTPKTKGGGYWKMWQNSTQQYYHLHCEKCGDYFPLYRPDVNWEEIWLYGYIVKCTHCSHEQDKRMAAETGKWIPLGDTENSDYVGFHINQLYIPHFTKEIIEKAMPERSPTNSERIYMNEVLGEFYDGEGGTISYGEIEASCSDLERRITDRISASENRKVYAGFDWGQKGALDQLAGRRQGRSYSCAVILTPIGPKLFQVEFATRLMRNDPDYKREVVEEMFRKYSVSLAVGDIGDAGDLTHQLQTDFGDMFLASRAVANVNKRIRFRDDVFPREIQFERDYYLSEMINLLKNGNIKFPWKSLDKIKWLVDHCSSMEIKITQDRKGDPIRHYIKGSTPNDGLMALLNAYLAWKFDVTQGFSIQQPGHMKYEVPFNKTSIPAIAAYMPGLKI